MDQVWKGLTFLIAVLVAWIGLQQWWLSRERLRLDLFGRRHSVFEATRNFIFSIVREANVDLAKQREFWAGTADAGFLFGSETNNYIDLLHKKAAELHVNIQMQESAVVDIANHQRKQLELLQWFAGQLRDDGLPRVFGRYLRFQDLQGPLSTAARAVGDWVTARLSRAATK